MTDQPRDASRRIAVVGGGPAGLSAALRLREREPTEVLVTLIERNGASEYLPGTIPVALGEQPPGAFVQSIELEGIELLQGEASGLHARGLMVDGRDVEADCVIAAPGLETEPVDGGTGVYAFWSPSEAAVFTDVLGGVMAGEAGSVAVVVSSLPYRCPPAPYSLAMQLASALRESGSPTRVSLTTPEEEPLAALGGGVPEFLLESCTEAGVQVHTGFAPDLEALERGELRSERGDELPADVKLVVPPHRRPAALAHLPGQGPLVEVSPSFETDEEGLFVVGDAAAAPFPRAAGPAEAAGRTAADAALARLGFGGREPHVPQPECYVGHGGGLFSRISLRYPEGLPPAGSAQVVLEGPSSGLAAGAGDALQRFRGVRKI